MIVYDLKNNNNKRTKTKFRERMNAWARNDTQIF